VRSPLPGGAESEVPDLQSGTSLDHPRFAPSVRPLGSPPLSLLQCEGSVRFVLLGSQAFENPEVFEGRHVSGACTTGCDVA